MGVERVPLAELLDYEQPTKYLVSSKDYDNANPTPVLTAGQTFILGYTDETTGIYRADSKEPVVIFDDFTTAFKWVDFPFKAKSSAMKMLTARDEKLASLRFIYYAMQGIGFVPKDHARHWISQYSKFEVALPPIEVQQEIVSILDRFVALEAELEAELVARRRQYAHYREELLSSFAPNVSVRETTLGDVARIVGRNVQPAAMGDSEVRVFSLPAFDSGLGPEVLIGTAVGSAKTRLETPCILVAKLNPHIPRVWRLDSIEADSFCSPEFYPVVPDPTKLNLGFLHQLLKSRLAWLAGEVTGSTNSHKRLQRESVLKLRIKLPPLLVQRKIAEVLQEFENLDAGIEMELIARRKQYEYYRDRLFNFPRLAA